MTQRSAAQLDSTPAERWVGHTATAHYTPVIIPPLRYPRDLPRLNAEWVRRMLSDSAVQLALAARKAPLLSVEFAYQEQGRWLPGIRASDPAIGQFVHRQLQRLWKRGIARLLDSAQIWGWGAGEVTFRRTRDAQLEVDQILVRDHGDVRPVVQDGALVGVEFRRLQKTQANRREQDKIALAFPRAIWHAHHPQSGQWFGWTVLAAAFSPWWDKHGSGGALDVRRLFMTKDGYRGTRIYYPSGYSTVQQPDGTTKQIPNHEIAMQIVETIRTGGVFALPSEVDANGTPRWKVEESQVSNNPSHILQYPKELDAEILNAMGIADDVLKSEATGSWAGKAVPQQATYCILEQWLSDLICDVDRVIEKLVEINFGPGHQYEITTRPLADQMLAQQNNAGPSPAPSESSDSPKGDPSNARQVNDLLRMGLDSPWHRMGWDPNQPRAPKGGVSIKRKFYPGGEFIPVKDFNQASPEERRIFEEKWREQDQPVEGGRIDGYEGTFNNFTQEQLDRLNELAKQAWSMRGNDRVIRGDGAAKYVDAVLEKALGEAPKRTPGREWPYRKEAMAREAHQKIQDENWRLANSAPKREITKGVRPPGWGVWINGMHYSGNTPIPPEKLTLASPLERRILARALRKEGRSAEIPPGFDYVEPPEKLLPGLTKGLVPENVGVKPIEPSYGTDAWLVWYVYHSNHPEHPQDGASALKQRVFDSFKGAEFTQEEFHLRLMEILWEDRWAELERTIADGGSAIIPAPGTPEYERMIGAKDFKNKILAGYGQFARSFDAFFNPTTPGFKFEDALNIVAAAGAARAARSGKTVGGSTLQRLEGTYKPGSAEQIRSLREGLSQRHRAALETIRSRAASIGSKHFEKPKPLTFESPRTANAPTMSSELMRTSTSLQGDSSSSHGTEPTNADHRGGQLPSRAFNSEPPPKDVGKSLSTGENRTRTVSRAKGSSIPPAKPRAYSSAFEFQLDPKDLGRSRGVHFARGKAALIAELEASEDFAQTMEAIIPGIRDALRGRRNVPKGWTWEHASRSTAGGREGVMRLVPRVQHTPGSPFWRLLHPDPGAAGGYSQWAIPRGAPKNRPKRPKRD